VALYFVYIFCFKDTKKAIMVGYSFFDLFLLALVFGHGKHFRAIVHDFILTYQSYLVSANADLTPKWKAGISTGYDFVQNGVTYTQLRFERDLLSWRMDFNWQPFGDQANWSFFIGIKSGVLSDIKYDKRSTNNR
jgi:hypothetical protein